jgi:hypothetical protein
VTDEVTKQLAGTLAPKKAADEAGYSEQTREVRFATFLRPTDPNNDLPMKKPPQVLVGAEVSELPGQDSNLNKENQNPSQGFHHGPPPSNSPWKTTFRIHPFPPPSTPLVPIGLRRVTGVMPVLRRVGLVGLPSHARWDMGQRSHESPLPTAGGRVTIPLPTLDALGALTVATPCAVPWREMHGDDRSRFCGQCRKPVYDLAAMTTAEAVALLAGPGGRPCVRLYRRADGRVMTADCPVGLRDRVWRWVRQRAAWAASLFALLFLPSCKTPLQGLPGDAFAGPAVDGRPQAEGGRVASPQSGKP